MQFSWFRNVTNSLLVASLLFISARSNMRAFQNVYYSYYQIWLCCISHFAFRQWMNTPKKVQHQRAGVGLMNASLKISVIGIVQIFAFCLIKTNRKNMCGDGGWERGGKPGKVGFRNVFRMVRGHGHRMHRDSSRCPNRQSIIVTWISKPNSILGLFNQNDYLLGKKKPRLLVVFRCHFFANQFYFYFVHRSIVSLSVRHRCEVSNTRQRGEHIKYYRRWRRWRWIEWDERRHTANDHDGDPNGTQYMVKNIFWHPHVKQCKCKYESWYATKVCRQYWPTLCVDNSTA